ncbi:MAG TPA: hypothetical protein VMD53_12700 [Rhizomicrobium sp.]|nr:hypothetical protein [Rhizomicrobium sp.]
MGLIGPLDIFCARNGDHPSGRGRSEGVGREHSEPAAAHACASQGEGRARAPDRQVAVSFVIEPLSSRHDRSAFSCGSEPLDTYLKTPAGQDIRRHISNCFVAVPEKESRVAGYYTLAASSIPVADIPAEISRKLPRYPVLPAALLGRLAVDRQFVRRSLGSALLYDAVARTLRADAAAFANDARRFHLALPVR